MKIRVWGSRQYGLVLVADATPRRIRICSKNHLHRCGRRAHQTPSSIISREFYCLSEMIWKNGEVAMDFGLQHWNFQRKCPSRPHKIMADLSTLLSQRPNYQHLLGSVSRNLSTLLGCLGANYCELLNNVSSPWIFKTLEADRLIFFVIHADLICFHFVKVRKLFSVAYP